MTTLRRLREIWFVELYSGITDDARPMEPKDTRAREVLDTALPTLNKMYLCKVDQVAEASDLSNQQKKSILSRLWHSMPVLFIILVSYLCCLPVDSVAEVQWVYNEHLRFQCLQQKDRNNEILGTLASHWDRHRETLTPLAFVGKGACMKCYRSLHGMSPSAWAKRVDEIKNGQSNWEHASCGHEGRLNEKGTASRMWMNRHFQDLGDWQPDTGEVHLPPMDKLDIHVEMEHELEELALSKTRFYHVWTKEFANVKVPPAQRMGKCTTCEDLHKEITSTRDKAHLRILKEARRKHIADVIADRRVYHDWRIRCRNNPDKYVCIILDGMDQSKTDIPDFNTNESPVQMTCRVVGGLVHSAKKEAYAYVVSHFTKETNTMIEVLRRILDARESLPPVLVLQLDNTWQENKNSRMFSFLASLVESGVFEEIIVNFLPVGHTHVSKLLDQ